MLDEPNPGLQRTMYHLRAKGGNTETPNALLSGKHTRGYLPHIKREGASYFVTFRLADSVPKEVIRKFESQKAERLQRLFSAQKNNVPCDDDVQMINRDFRRKVERYLDSGAGACHLRKPEIADVVQNALLHFNGDRYILHEWVVMPNHVHVIVWPAPNHVLSEILKSWKQFTSRLAKRMLSLKEPLFWQKESYDHWIRDDDEKARISRYIQKNPVIAGLCKAPERWPWGSARTARRLTS